MDDSTTAIEPILMPDFGSDSPASVYQELKDGERAVKAAAGAVFTYAEDVKRRHSAYDVAKNNTLKQLFQEEEEGHVKKRVEAQRTAIYRVQHAQLRLDWQLAEMDFQAQKSYLEALMSIQTSIEVRAKFILLDERFVGRNYT